MGFGNLRGRIKEFAKRNGALVRGTEFTVVGGFAVGGWTAGGDMTFLSPLASNRASAAVI